MGWVRQRETKRQRAKRDKETKSKESKRVTYKYTVSISSVPVVKDGDINFFNFFTVPAKAET